METKNNSKLVIYDAQGIKLSEQLIHDGKEDYVIDLADYPEGVYLLQIENTEKVLSKEIIEE